ncbi:MAG: 1-deoxy-D-xylulose-5-phosphate synthase [Kiritimatiellia bacterium]
MTTPLLTAIHSPADVKSLDAQQLTQLAQEIRDRMVAVVSHTGEHLAPSLGTVELTLALCKTFDFPKTKIVWDVGHQTYAWKILTGRNERMESLRQFGGIRGFPCPDESQYDAFVGGHAGVALSAALGMAAARDACGGDETIIAIVGDASLTNGISLEALNAVRHTTQRLILIINDNGMSIAKNVGAFSRLLGRRLADLRYNRIRAAAELAGHRLRLNWLHRVYHQLKSSIKPLLLRNRSAIFEDLGVRYMGPIDGHDISAICDALRSADEGHVPIALHIATVKGKGYAPAERAPSKWHGVAPWAKTVPVLDACCVEPVACPQTGSAVFGETLCALAQTIPAAVAITAAMREGTGLSQFFVEFPERAYDVGICEGHAVAFAAGLAAAGKRPVLALYSTFAQRAVDNFMHEVCLQNLPVVLCLDRAGIVGADGPTHHGLYDIAMFRALPNVALYAPTSAHALREILALALHRQGPTIIRYSRGAILPSFDWPHVATASSASLPLLALGDTVAWALTVAEKLGLRLIPVSRIKPLPDELAALKGQPIVTLENGSALGGFGSAVAESHEGRCLILGWPDSFIPQGSDSELRHAFGLDTESLVARISAFQHVCTSAAVRHD